LSKQRGGRDEVCLGLEEQRVCGDACTCKNNPVGQLSFREAVGVINIVANIYLTSVRKRLSHDEVVHGYKEVVQL